ncbi:MAG: hypothetical protein ACYC96_01185 [Fimbriimonadaceae bacterium]
MARRWQRMTVPGQSRSIAAIALGVSAAVLISAVGLLALTPEYLCSESLTYLLAALLVVTAASPIVVLWRRGNFEFCDVAVGVVFSYLMHFAFGAIFTTWFGATFISAQAGEPAFATLNGAVAVSIIGLVSMYVAYFGRPGARFAALFKELPANWNRRNIILYAFGAIFVGNAIRIGLMIGEAGSLSEFLVADKDALMRNTQGITYVAAFSSLAVLGLLALLVAGRLYKDRQLIRLFWITLPIDVLFRFFSGSRSSLVFLLLGLIVAFYLTSDRSRLLNRRYSMFCGMAILLSIAVFPLTTAIRFLGAASDPTEIFTASPQLQTLAGFTYFIGERFHGVQSLALLMDKVPREVPYNYGAPDGLLLVAWVPRSVWQDKPQISLALAFNEEILPRGLFAKNAAVAITIPGEYYWAFGLPGVVVGMFLFGLGMRALQSRLIAPRHSASAIVIAASMAQTFIQGIEQDSGYLVTYGLVTYLVALGFCKLMARGAKQ